jgi:hypothetical protein
MRFPRRMAPRSINISFRFLETRRRLHLNCMAGRAGTLFSFRYTAKTATGASDFFAAAKVSEPPADITIGDSAMENMVPQREHSTPPHWSRGDLVKVRSTAADTWRNAYVLIQRGHNLLLVIPEE